jgi:hypothetical protein
MQTDRWTDREADMEELIFDFETTLHAYLKYTIFKRSEYITLPLIQSIWT